MFKFLILVVAICALAHAEKLNDRELEKKAEHSYKDMCMAVADAQTYELVKAAYVTLKHCQFGLETKIDGTETSREQWESVITNICNNRVALQNCADAFNKEVKPCYERSSFTDFKATMSAVEKYNELMCASKRQEFIDFLFNNGFECCQKSAARIVPCIKNSFGKPDEPNKITSCFSLKAC